MNGEILPTELGLFEAAVSGNGESQAIALNRTILAQTHDG
jgi:hypothetical protein